MFSQLYYDKEKLQIKKMTIDLSKYTDDDILEARHLRVTLNISKPNQLIEFKANLEKLGMSDFKVRNARLGKHNNIT